MREVITINEACEYLRVHPSTLYRYLKKGPVGGAFKMGSDWRFRTEEFKRWVASLDQSGEANAGPTAL